MPVVSCPQCALYLKQIAQLELANEQLQAERDSFKKKCTQQDREDHRSAHPFAKPDDQLQDTPPKKSGRSDDHPPSNRPEPEKIDQVIPVPITTCPDCGTGLTDKETHCQYQTDIVITTITRQFNIESGYCPCCDRRQHARHELQTSDALGAAGNQIGPVVLVITHRNETRPRRFL